MITVRGKPTHSGDRLVRAQARLASELSHECGDIPAVPGMPGDPVPLGDWVGWEWRLTLAEGEPGALTETERSALERRTEAPAPLLASRGAPARAPRPGEIRIV